jgi:energy-coupling factor transporter ATP-binding protein EcfA2
VIKIEQFTFYYSGSSLPALKNVNLTINDGEFLLITGPSGGGKSSLCRCFNGLIPHFYGGTVSGRVEVQGIDTSVQSMKKITGTVGMIFQDPENQMVTTDVEREIAFGLENMAFPRDLIAKRIEESLDTLGISGLRHRQLHELSGGEKQKVAIASVLALHPNIIVLDEPTSELDPKGAEEVLSIIARLNDELGITIILVEHRLDRVVHLVDRVIILDKGQIAADGHPGEVFSRTSIADSGIGIPPIIRLVQGLRNNGFSIVKTPLTVKESRQFLDGIFENVKAPEPSDKQDLCGDTIITVEKLWHSYSNNSFALHDVNLAARESEFIAVMGRNASGKTTLVKHMNGLLKPTRGNVTIDGTNTREASIAQLARKVGYVFQNPNDHLFAETVEDEIAFTLKQQGYSSPEINARVNTLLEQFNLMQYRDRYPRSLSGGEKQRVALASIIASCPKILVLDEPTKGMEYKLKNELMLFLREYKNDGNVVILVTHDVETVAEHADRVILLSEGNIVVDGDRRDVLSKALLFSPQINRLVQAFAKYDLPGNILTADELLGWIP